MKPPVAPTGGTGWPAADPQGRDRRHGLATAVAAAMAWSSGLRMGSSLLGLAGAGTARAAGPKPGQRVLVIGGGGAGLAAVRTLRSAAPELSVTLLDREAAWRSLPLSNRWLLGAAAEPLPRVPLTQWAARHGTGLVVSEVLGIDRAAATVHTVQGPVPYDWLLLATGAVSDYGAWTGRDAKAAARVQQQFPAGFETRELDALKSRLEAFGGGTLLLTVPPPPFRCPPAPYERAVLLASWMRRRGLRGRLLLVDAGGGMPRFNRLFDERWAGTIEHHRHATVRHVDAEARELHTQDGVLRFDHALILPPMHAGPLAAQAKLLADPNGDAASHWIAADPATGRTSADERIYVAGDALGPVSPLFGSYPKTAQIAAELGVQAALQIAATSRGRAPPDRELPTSECHVWLSEEPPEQLRLQTRYRLRGDGLIMQTVRQVENPQPRGEDLSWVRQLATQKLGIDAS